ncbi:hypothetical protein ILUMI_19978 [Ignelater luminosus]|uniref:BPTI/Kunitz inhibitor domain-containing protein n=1 Tax=Ignelater luminosus TaxID=2038154 RepID=A0A8K0CLV2_IGNLU|nr:hypothetical protein ILUMI_19978 [Ignelater luminosus]
MSSPSLSKISNLKYWVLVIFLKIFFNKSTGYDRSSICELPFDIGPCEENIPVWWYNAQTKNCYQVYYSGCGGNPNNFLARKQCVKICKRGDRGICEMPFEVGKCKMYYPVWYYNYATDDCERGIYGGCGGNSNRFSHKQDCLDHCIQTSKFEYNSVKLK